ncbi:MAG: cyclase family protein, partial [Flavobacteriales bacterium]
MVITFPHLGQTLHADLARPLDISLPLTPGPEHVGAFFIPPMTIEPLRIGDFVGDVLQGAPCNVNDVRFNPHGNGTHTETVGHISREKESIHECLKRFWFLADVVSV